MDVRSLIGGHFLETEIAQSIPKEFDSQGGILIGGGSEPRAGEVKDRWQVVYTTVFEDTYVRVDPATGGSAGYTFFDIGAIADLVQVKNTLWHQFGGATTNQTRYADRGTSTRLSDAFESTVAGPAPLVLHGGANEDVALPYLKNYGPTTAYTEDTGTLFGVSTAANASLGGIREATPNRRLVLVNEGEGWVTVVAESAATPPAHRFRSSMGRPTAIAPGGSASFVYVGPPVQRWQLTGHG